MTRLVTLAGYAIIAITAIAYDLTARRRGTATFTDAVAAVTRTRIGKWLVLAGWLWLGWHLFVRTGER